MLFMEKKCHSQITDLLLRKRIAGYQIDGLQVPKVDIPSQDINVKQLQTLSVSMVRA